VIKTTPILRKNSKAYREGYQLIINQGGQGSSKTYSILTLFYILAKVSKQRLIFTICSYALPHLKLGAIRDFEDILISAGEDLGAIHNKSDHFFKIGNSIIDYFGIRDNYSKVTGPRRDFLFINEANNKVTYDDFDQLNQRTHQCTFVDYNPRSEFWLHDMVIPHFKHAFIKSTFLDNPHIPKAEIDKILWKKDKPQFENWWRVYGLGEVGQLEGTILSNWRYGEFDDYLPYQYGLDFGFHPDPDFLVKTAIDRKAKKMYWHQCFMENEQKLHDLKDNIEKNVNRKDLIIADCADKRLIAELKQILNIKAVSKRGTVSEWLRLLQDYEHIVTETSYDLAKEFNNYIWNDKKAGIPIDDWNHGIDAGRYTFMDTQKVRKKGMKRVN